MPSVDTPFTTFPFVATGAPTPRTMPDRLSDVFNVKDYGAVGDYDTDDTAAIRLALAAMWATSTKGGTLYFPAGKYRITETIDIGNSDVTSSNTNGRIIGAGRYATLITGAINNGFLFQQLDAINGPSEISNLSLANTSTWIGSGALMINNSSALIHQVHFAGMINVLGPFNLYEFTLLNCTGSNWSDPTTGYNGTLGIAAYAPNIRSWRSTNPYHVALQVWGSNGTLVHGAGVENSVVGLMLGSYIGWASSCTVSGNILTVGGTLGTAGIEQFQKNAKVYGRGINLPTWGLLPDGSTAVTIIDDHISDPTLTGVGYAGTYRISQTLGSPITTPIPVYSRVGFAATGVSVAGYETEACYYALYLNNCNGCHIAGGIFTGQPTECVDAFGTTGYTAHSGVYLLTAFATKLEGIKSGPNPYAGSFYIAPGSVINNVTFDSCVGNKLPDIVTGNTSTISNGSGGAGTILNVVSVASGSTIGIGMSVTGTGVTAGTVITGNAASDGTLTGTGTAGTYRVNNSQNLSARVFTIITGTDWVPPIDTYSKAGIKFINCGGILPAGVSSGLNTLNMTFTCLPGQAGSDSNVQLVEGQEFDIVDSNTATWGATAAGSGSNHVKVRYNGTNWTVVGK